MDIATPPSPPAATDPTVPTPAARVEVTLRPGEMPDTFAAWSQWVNYLAESTLVEEAHRADFTVGIRIVLFAGMTLSTTRLSHPQRQRRSEAMVAATGLDQILLWFYPAGGVAGRFHRREVNLEAGGLTLLDFAKPFEILIEPSTIIGLVLPRDRLPARLRDRDLHGLVVTPQTPSGRLLLDALSGLERAAPDLTEAEGVLAIEAVLLLLEAALTRTAASSKATATPAELDLLARAQAHIEPRLAEAALAVEDVAAGLDVSRAALQRAFESFGGVAAYIRERRLIRSHEIIVSDFQPYQAVSAIAVAQGFGSEAHFSRAFKQRFGIGSRAARKAAQERRRAGQALDPAPITPGVAPLAIKPMPASAAPPAKPPIDPKDQVS